MDVTLPPELERFAAEAIAKGRYRDMTEVVAAGVSLLREAETEASAFAQTLEDARSEAEQEGWIELDDVLAEADEIIRARGERAA